MAAHRVEDIRNIALVGHRASGKTSLADALLFKAKAVDRRGSVDDGTSVSDYDEEEKKHHFSIDTQHPAPGLQGQTHLPARHPRQARFRRRRPGRPQRRRDGRHRHFRRHRHPGQHPPHVRRSRQARPGPHARHQQARRATTSTSTICSSTSKTPSARTACCSTRPIGVGPELQRRRQRAQPARVTRRPAARSISPPPAPSSSTPSSRATKP